MINFEKFYDAIVDIGLKNFGVDSLTGKPANCATFNDKDVCVGCAFVDCDDCSEAAKEWLLKEAKEDDKA